MKFTSISLPILIASLIAIFLLVHTWQRHTMRGARPLLPLLLSIVIWLGGSTIEGLYFTDRASALTGRNLRLLSIMPLVTLVLVWTSSGSSLERLKYE